MKTETTIYPFDQLKKGMQAKIVRLNPKCDELARLADMGFTLGATFKVVKVAPFGDPVEIDIRGSRICLRKSETHCFDIELIQQ